MVATERSGFYQPLKQVFKGGDLVIYGQGLPSDKQLRFPNAPHSRTASDGGHRRRKRHEPWSRKFGAPKEQRSEVSGIMPGWLRTPKLLTDC